MKRIDTATRFIDLFGPGKPGFRNGDLANGVAPTDFNALWANMVQEEIANVVEAAGLVLNGAVYNQMLEALRAMFTSRQGFPSYFQYSSAGPFSLVIPANITLVHARVWAAGGGGGGAGAATAAGAGGGAGGYAEGVYVVTPGATIGGTVGAGGVGGALGGGNGGAGGSSSFGFLLSASGGTGGQGSASAIAALAGTGGVGAGGNLINLGGQNGTTGLIPSTGVTFCGVGGGVFCSPPGRLGQGAGEGGGGPGSGGNGGAYAVTAGGAGAKGYVLIGY